MICPACNYEILLHNDFCEHCGAPAYLATAIQTTEITHCTYCGARCEIGSDFCATCGLKKDFKTNESLIGTCRNCGVAWRNVWLYCQICGVARENGLVDTTPPVATSFQTHFRTVSAVGVAPSPSEGFYSRPIAEQATDRFENATDSRETLFTYSDFNLPSYDAADEPEANSWLSENEVVERMYANGKEETAPTRRMDLGEFFSTSEIADRHQPSNPARRPHSEAPLPNGSPVVYDLRHAAPQAPVSQAQPVAAAPARAIPVREPQAPPIQEQAAEKKVGVETIPAPPLLPQRITSEPSSVNPPVSLPATEASNPTTPSISSAETISLNKKPESATTTTATTAATKSNPVQTVRFINRPRTPTTPPVDKRLVKFIAALIFLILVFSALIVSGFRIRDLLSKSPAKTISPNNLQPEAKPSPAASQATATLQAPNGMAYIPGGKFWMGADEGDSYEAPSHEVTVAPFFMDQAEVTREQYAAFAKATNHPLPPDWKNGKYDAGTDRLPVVNISWQDANDYATWAGKRLPTEAEWEFAARAQDGRRYPWGSNWDEKKANTIETNLNHPVEVGNYANASHPFGLVDLAGNVWEWTAGDVTSYKDAGITLAPGKVIRGGAFYAPKERATTTYRGFAPPDKQAPGIGFRCVKDVN